MNVVFNNNSAMSDRKEKMFSKSFRFEGLEYTSRGKTPEEAAEKAAFKRQQLEQGIDIREHRKDREEKTEMAPPHRLDKSSTVNEVFEKWLESLSNRVRKPDVIPKKGDHTILKAQYNRYVADMTNHVLPYIGTEKIGSIRKSDLEHVLHIAAQIPLSKSSVSKIRDAIRLLFRFAKEDNIIKKNTAKKIALPAINKKTVERDAFDADTIKAIEKVAETDRFGDVVLAERELGTRNGELIALRVSDISLSERRIDIRSALKSKENAIGPPKSNESTRELGLTGNGYDLFKRLTEGKDGNEFVFTKENGERMTESYFQNEWMRFRKKVLIELGAEVDRYGRIKGLRYSHNRPVKTENPTAWEKKYFDMIFYDLRHTFRTELMESGVPDAVACKIMGHTKESDIVYKHQRDPSVQESVKQLELWRKKES